MTEPARHEAPPREISTQLSRGPYCYELGYDNRLESVANAHTAADLHVRPVSKTALVLQIVGARERSKKYTRLRIRQSI